MPDRHRIISLRIVLVLSIIGSGLGLIYTAILGIFYNEYQQFLASMPDSLPEEMATVITTMIETPRAQYLSMSVFYTLSLLGVILMWNIKRSGFHCYTLSQIVLLALPVLFADKSAFNIGDAMITLLFVVYYFFSLYQLGAFGNNAAEEKMPDDGDEEPGSPE